MSDSKENPSQKNNVSQQDDSGGIAGTPQPSLFADYGDFAFGYRISSRRHRRWQPHELQSRNTFDNIWIYPDEPSVVSGRERYESIEVEEIDLFERSGSFNFYKFPSEIRSKIFREVCEPVMYRDENEKPTGLKLQVRRTMGSDKLPGGSFPAFDPVHYEDVFEIHPVQTPEHKAWVKRLRESVKSGKPLADVGFDHYVIPTSNPRQHVSPSQFCGPHPFRHDGSTHAIDVIARPTGNNSGYLMAYLEWIRKTLNVSRVFRQELNKALWQRITLYSTLNVHDLPVPEFLEGRPAIHKNIKALHLSTYCRVAPVLSLGGGCEDLKLSQAYFASLAKYLELETLTLSVELTVNNPIGAIVQSNDMTFLKDIRKISVTSSFSVNVREKKGREYADQSPHAKWLASRIDELARPDTLRVPPPPPSEVDNYLTTRLLPMAIGNKSSGEDDNEGGHM